MCIYYIFMHYIIHVIHMTYMLSETRIYRIVTILPNIYVCMKISWEYSGKIYSQVIVVEEL